jgi:DNA-binding PadR family transcriptional regulator
MSPRRRRSNPLALAVLACVLERPMHPYEIASTLRERAKHESIRLNYGSLYGVVEALARDGLIEPVETGRAGRRPERTVYAGTDAGRAEFVDWLTDLLRTPVKEYPQFEAGLSLMPGLPPEEVAALLGERCRLLEDELGRWRARLAEAAAHGIPRLVLIEGEFHVSQREAELEFTRALAREVAEGTLEGMDFWKSIHHARSTT